MATDQDWDDLSLEQKIDLLRDDFLKLSAGVAESARRADAAHLGLDPIAAKLEALEARVSKLVEAGSAG